MRRSSDSIQAFYLASGTLESPFPSCKSLVISDQVD